MEKYKGNFYRLRNNVSLEIEQTKYTIIAEEPDAETDGLIWYYLESEYGDENIEYEPKFNIYYAKITNNQEGLLV